MSSLAFDYTANPVFTGKGLNYNKLHLWLHRNEKTTSLTVTLRTGLCAVVRRGLYATLGMALFQFRPLIDAIPRKKSTRYGKTNLTRNS